MSNLLISLDKLLILLSQCICLNIIFYLIQINYLWCLSRYLKFRSNNIVKCKIWFLLTDINPLLNSDFLFFYFHVLFMCFFYLYFLCRDSLKREHFKVWNKAYRHFFPANFHKKLNWPCVKIVVAKGDITVLQTRTNC